MLFVAANDSSAADKDAADYVCDSVDDQVEIQAAIDLDDVTCFDGTFLVRPPSAPGNALACLFGAGDGQIIQGSSASTILKTYDTQTTSRINSGLLQINGYTGCTVQDFTLTSSAINGTTDGAQGLQLIYGGSHVVQRVKSHLFDSHQLLIASVTGATISNCHTISTTRSGDPEGGDISHGLDIDEATDDDAIQSDNIIITDTICDGIGTNFDASKVEHCNGVTYRRVAFLSKVAAGDDSLTDANRLSNILYDACYFAANFSVTFRGGDITVQDSAFGAGGNVTETESGGVVFLTRNNWHKDSALWSGDVTASGNSIARRTLWASSR